MLYSTVRKVGTYRYFSAKYRRNVARAKFASLFIHNCVNRRRSTATARRTSLNRRFYEQNNGCVPALRISAHAFPCNPAAKQQREMTMSKFAPFRESGQLWPIQDQFFIFLFGIEHGLFVVS